jgi:phosphoglucomutase
LNKDSTELISVEKVVRDHWATYGRNYYQRYDYEGLTTEDAQQIFKLLEGSMTKWEQEVVGNKAINFSYTDPVDQSVSANQGYIFSYPDGSRFVFRQSGTGSSGATIRIYLERYSNDASFKVEDALSEIAKQALKTCQITEITGR